MGAENLIGMDREMNSIVEEICRLCPHGGRTVFVSGNFNVVHPGHLRLLNFAAECGDFLVVGVHEDGSGLALLPEQLRLEGVRSISVVSYAFILRVPPEDFIPLLKPPIVVKGKEHESRYNAELSGVESYGGKLLFSSGDVRFSSLDLLQRELLETKFSTINKPLDFPERRGFEVRDLVHIVQRFSNLRLVVVGDLIVDEYISCDPLGMSQEDPTLVVMPIKRDQFVGGAGIVAAHARGLGAQVSYYGVTGNDTTAEFAEKTLKKYDVKCDFLVDDSRPTTLKQRYCASGKTLLRVSHLRQHDISKALAEELYGQVVSALDQADLLIFSDFNYGCLPQALVDAVAAFCRRRGIMMVADSQASSQIGDVSRFCGMRLLTPTEHEARLAMRDYSSGLVALAESLRQRAEAHQLIVTLGAEGLLIHAPNGAGNGFLTDQLPAMNSAPKDVSGAGDSLLTCTALALAANATIWESAYLGSVASACQVARVGNTPLSAKEMITELLDS